MSILDCLEQKPMGPRGLSDNWLSKWFPSYFQPLKNCVRFNPFLCAVNIIHDFQILGCIFKQKKAQFYNNNVFAIVTFFVAKNRIVNFAAFFYQRKVINQNRLNLSTAKVSSQGSHVIYFFDRTFLLQNVKRFLPWNYQKWMKQKFPFHT